MRTYKDDIRVWHYIKRNLKTSTPTSLLFVDTETHGIPIEGNSNATLQVLTLWCAEKIRMEKGRVRARSKHNGNTAQEFWNLVYECMNDGKPLWLLAHNVGFDLTILGFWQRLESGIFSFTTTKRDKGQHVFDNDDEYKQGFAVIDDPPTIIECYDAYTGNKLIINDTYNYFRCSVKRLGESVGLPKLDMPEHGDNEERLFEYCQRDVAIIAKAITDLMLFVQKHDLGQWRYTAPAQAFSAFRHRFMKHKILVHGNKEAIDLEREAYYGGRLENHFIGKVYDTEKGWFGSNDPKYPNNIDWRYGPVYVLDIQSCYPAQMLWQRYPIKLCNIYKMVEPSALREWIKTYACIARVTIQSPTEPFPVHRSGRTFMATGKFITSLCGPELIRAIATSSVKNIGMVALYDASDIFSEYVAFFWNLRYEAKKKGDIVQESWCKLMLNSLGGKFGQRARKWEANPDVESPFPWYQWCERDKIKHVSRNFRSLAFHVQEEQVKGESIDSCPSISAYITSYAREYLHMLITCAGYDNTYYVDTDCLHVNEAGYVALTRQGYIKENTLGMLSLKGTYDTAEYRGLKDYSVGDEHIISGVKANAEQVRARVFRQDKFQRLVSVLSSEPKPGVRVDRVTIDRTKGLEPQRIQPDGTVRYQVVYE